MSANPILTRIQQVAKALHLGPLVYQTYYAPKGFLQKCQRQGITNMAIDYWSCRQMEAAAYQLPRPNLDATKETYNIYFLSGRKFWYQTCFCAYSLAQQADINVRPIIYDDGTLEQHYLDAILQVFPNTEILLISEIEAQLEQSLPISRFPYLRERRISYPNLRKLTDIHAGSQGWKLVLDSDMLFFRFPTFLVDWLKSPQQPCCMVDMETAYGYSSELMCELAHHKIPERINVGICGLNSSAIDWEQLEFWCRTMIEQEGTHYYQEQALVAMLLAQQSSAIAPAIDYIVMPNYDEAIQPQAILHHYVSDSKPWYFRYGWKHIVSTHVTR
jgi:hypothetical protein